MAKNTPKYIVIHTAAHGTPEKNYDTTASQINDWHNANGWNGIGYHYVVRLNGAMEKGRPEESSGAHTVGLNRISIGICFSGHADYHDWTPEQRKAGMELIRSLMRKYNIDADHVIGHRESGMNGRPGKPVSKTCPGKKIDMNMLRSELSNSQPAIVATDIWGAKLFHAMKDLYAFAEMVHMPETFVKDLHDIRYSARVNEIINAYKEKNGH